MRRALLRLATLVTLLLSSSLAYGQGANTVMRTDTGAPVGNCSFVMLYTRGGTNELYACRSGSWFLVGPGAAGAASWSSLTDPGGNLALSHAAFTSTFTWGATTGAGVNMFTLRDTTFNTGTGYVLSLNTATGSAAKPLRVTSVGTANGVEMDTAGLLLSIGTGGIQATVGDSATGFFPAGALELVRGGTNQTAWTAARCVRVNAGGTALESHTSDCAAGGSGITTLNTLTDAVQTFTDPDDTNVTLAITSAAANHAFTMGWTGQLAVGRGGTGLATITANQLIAGRGASPPASIPEGTTGQVLISNGAGADPSFQDPLITYNQVLLFNDVAATATQTSAAVTLSTRMALGTLNVTGTGITGSPSGCTLVYRLSLDAVDTADIESFAFTPGNNYQNFKTTPTGDDTAADQMKVVYNCTTFPTAGTLTVSFSPARVVAIRDALPTGTNTIGAVNQGTPAATANRWPVQITDGTDLALVTAAGEVNVLASAQPGVDIGDVTVNNAAGASAVNIQDGGNSLTVDGTVNIGTFPDNEPFNLAQVGGTATVTGGVAGSLGVGGLAASGAAKAGNPNQVGYIFNTTQPTVTTGQAVEAQGTARGAAIVATGVDTFNVTVNSPLGGGTEAAAVRVTVANDSTGLLSVDDNGGSLTVDQPTAASLNMRPDTSGATGAAPPARADFIGGLTSGATGGFLTGITVCDTFVNVNVVTATTTLLVTGVSGRHVRLCSLSLVTAGANNVALISGTGATCGTGTTGMTGGTTAATGWNFAANGGLTQGGGVGEINRTNAAGDSVCIVTSAAVQLSGRITYTIY